MAHSVQGHGARIYPNPVVPAHTSTCYEGSYFSAYKVQEEGVVTHDAVKKIVMSNMQLIDNEWGLNLIIGGEPTTSKVAEIKDFHIYGETAGLDDRCQDRYGAKLA